MGWWMMEDEKLWRRSSGQQADRTVSENDAAVPGEEDKEHEWRRDGEERQNEEGQASDRCNSE